MPVRSTISVSIRRIVASTLFLPALAALAVLVSAGCAAEPQVERVEVTREIPVTREVPVTVERTKTIEVTREVPVVREVPVTVEVIKTVEVPVTREVIKEIEVIREVPVTPAVTPTPEPTMVASPTPSATPVPVPASTPSPANPRFGSWEMESGFFAGRTVSTFRNLSTSYDPLPDSPVLTFQCDNRGYRSMHIDWRHPVVGVLDTSLSPYVSDPFDIYRKVDAEILLADYARQLHAFVDGMRLNPQDAGRFRELWREIQRRYELSELTSPEDLIVLEEPEEDPDQQVEAEPVLSANRGSALLELEFSVEIPKYMGEEWYRPSVRANIRSDWRVLPNQRTLMGDSAIGSIHQSYQSIAPPRSEEDSLRVITATVYEPEQPVGLSAKWEATGLDRILEHCRETRS